ncbi:hypothetical protein OC834_002102 [Tilletia horrida]|nr:hypothetical protein OC834_002102 [Tilletia horrida]
MPGDTLELSPSRSEDLDDTVQTDEELSATLLANNSATSPTQSIDKGAYGERIMSRILLATPERSVLVQRPDTWSW